MKLTKLFIDFFNSEKSGGIVLLLCTIVSLSIANSGVHEGYLAFWHHNLAGHSLAHWVNDGLMTVFFLLIGLELEREIYIGELSDIKNTLLPVFAALGGMIFPAGIHFFLNRGTEFQPGAGIPMATDIAFAIGILSLLGKRVPPALKVFLIALAVIDDLGAIIIIALFYSSGISILHLSIAMGIMLVLFVLNRLKVYNLLPYIAGGVLMWYFMLHSGIHATITGVLLAFVIPFGKGDEKSPSYILEEFLQKPVAFLILPIFALANTAIVIGSNLVSDLTSTNGLGIFLGLVIGKFAGIVLFSYLAVKIRLLRLPEEIRWKHIAGVGFLGGIGFTMSIFISLLAFDDPALINASKLSILVSSLMAGLIGYTWLTIGLPHKKFNHPD